MKYLVAIGIAALAGLLVVLVMGGDPGSAFGTFLWSSLGSLNGLSQTLNKLIECYFRGICDFMEHGLPKKCPSHRDAVQSSDKSVFHPRLHAVGHAQAV